MNRPKRTTPVWGRLETRVVAALVLLGTLCVGASAYLVQMTVEFFDQRMGQALDEGEQLAEAVGPFHRELVATHIDAYRARAQAFALEVQLAEAKGGTAQPVLDKVVGAEPDVLSLALEVEEGSRLVARSAADQDDSVDRFQARAPAGAGRMLLVGFRIDPGINARYQEVGSRRRKIGRQQASLPELQSAVLRGVAVVFGVVLTLAVLGGFVLARATTRRVSQLSATMDRVGHGDLDVRAPTGGRDELAQLAAAFNQMLDELAAAQHKVAYLQRIGAWQGMARRIAHEIKNPLTPIQLAIQQLREKDPGLSPEFSRLLTTSTEIVEDEVAALRRMVQSFSQFAKVPEVRLEPVRLGRVLEEFERAYGHLTERESDSLVVDPPGDPELTVLGDRQLLKQALVNLVENAVLSAHEADRDVVQVRVATRPADQDPDMIEIRIDDNGPGIPADRRVEVFEPYETSRAQGTGLGLAIVKKVILDHGGTVRVEDSDLGGARFVLSLPRAEPGADPSPV